MRIDSAISYCFTVLVVAMAMRGSVVSQEPSKTKTAEDQSSSSNQSSSNQASPDQTSSAQTTSNPQPPSSQEKKCQGLGCPIPGDEIPPPQKPTPSPTPQAQDSSRGVTFRKVLPIFPVIRKQSGPAHFTSGPLIHSGWFLSRLHQAC